MTANRNKCRHLARGARALDPGLRVDPLSGLKVILAPTRAGRPFDLEPQIEEDRSSNTCPFCEGQESKTPPEISALRPRGGEANAPGWQVRVVPNKYPLLVTGKAVGKSLAASEKALDHLSPEAGRGEPKFFAGGAAGGEHEVIVHSPQHLASMVELPGAQLALAMGVWRERMRAQKDAAYVHLMVNEGAAAGASLAHTHAQLVALPFVPPHLARQRERFTAHFERTEGGCLLCDLLQEEVRLQDRVVAVDDDIVLLAPFAAQLPFQLQIVPRRHQMRFEQDEGAGSAMLLKALRLLKERLGGAPPLNLWVRTAPSGANHFHWHIEIVPRLTTLAGLELGAGAAVNVLPPEQVAAELRSLPARAGLFRVKL